MGNDEAVTPVFPNSDYCTGVAGSIAVMHALVRRAEEGGSWGIDVSTANSLQVRVGANVHARPL
jgi:crotonobetainyl-CoA:carnitine CoA-transferase CaiB-like acyl-CoA transferase